MRHEFLWGTSESSGIRFFVDKLFIQSRPRREFGGRIAGFEFRENFQEFKIVHDFMSTYRHGSLEDEFLAEIWKLAWGLSEQLVSISQRGSS